MLIKRILIKNRMTGLEFSLANASKPITSLKENFLPAPGGGTSGRVKL